MVEDGERIPRSGVVDAFFPYADRDEADAVRRFSVEAFRAVGIAGTDRGKDFLTDDGRVYEYGNALVTCLLDRREEKRWREIASGYVERGLSDDSGGGVLDVVVDEETFSRVLPMFAPLDLAGPQLWERYFTYALIHSPRIRMLLVLESNGLERYVTDAMLTRETFSATVEKAVENLWSEVRGRHYGLGEPENRLHFLEGSTRYTSAYAMNVDNLLRNFDRDSARDLGVVYSLPRANVVMWANLTARRSSLAMLESILASTLKQYRDFRAPLSPEVFWWREGKTEIINGVGKDAVESSERFARVLEAMRNGEG
jgi:hypothetical protein